MTDDDYTTRTRTVRLAVDAAVTRPWRRGGTWTVEAGRWRADGATEKAAADTLATGLQKFLAEYRTPSLLTFRGYVAVVSPDLGDADNPLVWDQQIVSPDGHVRCSSGSAGSLEEAEAHARHSMAQMSTDWHDDASVQEAAKYLDNSQDLGGFRGFHYGPDELYRYAAWQRAAKAAMDAGRDDWHEWASAHEADFAVARPKATP